MRIVMMVAALTALAGCANTPKEMQALGSLESVVIPAGHKPAAECAIRKFDETSGLSNSLRVYEGYSEIVGTGGPPISYVDFRPEKDGTVANVYVSDNALFRGMIGGRLATALRECATEFGSRPTA